MEKAPPTEPARVAAAPQATRSEETVSDETVRPRSAPRKLIRTVDLEVRVNDAEAAAAEVTRLIEESGGYVASRTVVAHEGFHSFHLTLRVPVEALDGVLESVRALAVEVTRESQRSEDVTDRFVDLGARLRTLESTERELLGLLSESRSRGHGAEDIMAIYRELTEVRTRIEQLQGQLNLLENQTALSTLDLEIWPTEAATPVIADAWRPLDTLRGSVRLLLGALRGLADLAIFLVVVVLPVAVLVGGPLWLLGRALRRARQRGAAGSRERDVASSGGDG